MKLIRFFKNDFSFNKKLLRLIKSLFLLAISITSVNAAQTGVASNVHSVEKIRQAAKKFLEEKQQAADNPNIVIKIGHIDNRLRLTQCDSQLEMFLPQAIRSSGKTTVGVKCDAPVSWKIYVAAEINWFQQAWVLNRNVARDTLLSKNDVSQRKIKMTAGRRIPLLDVNQIINSTTKNNMRRGAVVFQDSVCFVCRGDKVTVTAKSQFLNVDVEGVALSDAMLGESVQVRNSSSKKIFAAQVTSKSQLSVNLTGIN
ncbi:flagellar basal body P-ring formation chaperone FlgA [Aliikangiella sp. IMCC44653]